MFRWPFSVIDSNGRAEEEFVFFDDMLACAAAMPVFVLWGVRADVEFLAGPPLLARRRRD